VFHPLTYEGAVDPAAEGDPRRRAALEAQINEFGQCPRRLFREPHPPRLTARAGVPASKYLFCKAHFRILAIPLCMPAYSPGSPALVRCEVFLPMST